MPATATKFFASDVAHLATTTVGSQLEIVEYAFRLTQPRQRNRAEEVARQRALMRSSALFLELTVVAVCAHEALAKSGAETFEAAGKEPGVFVRRVRELAGLDPVHVLK